MNPASNAATSAGVAGAFVVVLSWVLSHWNITVPSDVAASVSVLLTALGGYYLHIRSSTNAGFFLTAPKSLTPPKP